MSIDSVSTPGNVLFLNPAELASHGFPCQVIGPHPFVIVACELRDGVVWSHIVPLTSKGSLRSAVPIPSDFIRGTERFLSKPSFIYSVFFAQWCPAWVLLEACCPSPSAYHNGNCLTPDGVEYVRRSIAPFGR